MGAQSLVIGKMFGEGFQYGKRKISAMPNEEFNALTFEKMMSNARDEMQASIPTMIQAMQDMKPMVSAVIHEFTNYLSLVIKAAPSEVENIIGQAAHAAFPHEKNIHTDEQNIFESIAEQFPHIHEAGATDMVGTKIKIPLFEDTQAKRIALQAKEDARVERLQRLLEAKRRAELRLQQRKIVPAPHIISRSASNVSMQSLRLHRQRLQVRINQLGTARRRMNNKRSLAFKNLTIKYNKLRQEMADFMKMHGARF